MGKADNMLAILWMLRSGKRMTASQLADELEIHVRTVYRCIDSLCASGVPIVADVGPGGGYSIMDRFADSPLLFEPEEQKGLIHAAMFAREAGYPHSDALDRAVDKLKRYANEKQLELLERHGSGLSAIYPAIDDHHRVFLALLEQAAGDGRTLEMDYDKGKGEKSPSRPFDPYGVVHWKGNWYAVGHCGFRMETRSFRVDRILALRETDGRFERPAGFSAREFLLGHLLPTEESGAELVDVRIVALPQALNELCRHWLFGHAVTEREASAAVFRLDRSALMTHVPYFLLPYGRCLTIENEVLLKRMAEVTAEMAQHYGTMHDDDSKRREDGNDG